MPSSSCAAGVPKKFRVELKFKGLGSIVPVLLPGTACLSASSPLLRGRLRREGLRGMCFHGAQSPEPGCWTGCAASGRRGAGSTVRLC